MTTWGLVICVLLIAIAGLLLRKKGLILVVGVASGFAGWL